MTQSMCEQGVRCCYMVWSKSFKDRLRVIEHTLVYREYRCQLPASSETCAKPDFFLAADRPVW